MTRSTAHYTQVLSELGVKMRLLGGRTLSGPRMKDEHPS
jgi:hypothetical protein